MLKFCSPQQNCSIKLCYSLVLTFICGQCKARTSILSNHEKNYGPPVSNVTFPHITIQTARKFCAEVTNYAIDLQSFDISIYLPGLFQQAVLQSGTDINVWAVQGKDHSCKTPTDVTNHVPNLPNNVVRL